MRKNGFTIIEITVAVLLLSILTVFIVPRVSTIISTNNNKVCDSIITSIEEAAKNYAYLHTNIVDSSIENNTYFEITLKELQKEGLLDINLEDPYTNEIISNTNIVKITKEGNVYFYTYMGEECK